MKIIKMKDLEVFVDDEDFDKLSKVSWYKINGVNTTYAGTDLRTRVKGETVDGCQFLMHRAVLNLPSTPNTNDYVDHINGNGLDNQKHNLRIVTQQLNTFNIPPKHKNKSSIYKGVMKAKKSWNVQIKLNYKSNSIGTYKDEIYAAKVYDAVVRFYTGDVGYVNFKEVYIEPMSVETAKSYNHKILINNGS